MVFRAVEVGDVMAYIEIINETAATPELRDDDEFISGSYSKMAGMQVPTPWRLT
ncbi:MAG: hypothetical protein V3R27_05250 [Pseudomonadales bacterium]